MHEHLSHNLCETHTALELEAIKEEAYSRAEAYPMERFMKVSAWLMKVLEDAQAQLGMLDKAQP